MTGRRRRKIETDAETLAFIGINDPIHQRIAVRRIPCGIETVKEALDDRTSVIVNAPRALLICAWKGMLGGFVEAEKESGGGDE